MFADRLTEIMKILNVNNRQLSEYSKLDSSSLSRFTKGSRIPSRGSVTVGKIVNGLCLYCETEKKTEALCSHIGTSTARPPESIKSDLTGWLFKDQPIVAKSSGSRSSDNSKAVVARSSRKKFGARFNDVMDLAGMSNITLSRKAYVDPSLISRYRSGLRSPINNPEVAELLSSIIFKQIEATGRISDLSVLMDTIPEMMNESLFNRWLYADELNQAMGVTSTEKLLTAFEAFTPPSNIEPSARLDILMDESEDTGKKLYEGSKGLCSAVIRFLSTAVRTKAKELFLFSNQSMDWMTEDSTFLSKWTALMKACVINGTRIHIIHNVDRSYEEMNSAIIAWLPLYMSGTITPYYCTLPSGALFTQTLFLNPGRACINANLVSGTEKTGLFYYYAEEPYLSFMQNQFDTMLSYSKPLVEILPAGSASITDFAGSEDLRIIQPALSIMSMPESVAEAFDSPQFMNIWNDYNNLSRALKNRRVFECVPLCSPDMLEKSPAKVEAVPEADGIFYTKDQYKKHIGNIISIMNSRPGYRLVALPQTPFSNMQLIISDEQVRITRTAPPFISFTFTHPQMCHAFKNYSDRLIRQYMSDRRIMINMLRDLYL